MTRPSSPSWLALGAVAPDELVEARAALHLAAQPLAAAAYALLEAPEDHSHANLNWDAGRRGLLGRALPRGSRLLLDVAGYRAVVLGVDGRAVATIPLAGKTHAALAGELAAALREAGERLPASGLEEPPWGTLESRFAAGEPLPGLAPAVREELARWFGNAAAALGGVAAELLGGAEVRGWPHHFDLAALRVLDPGRDAEEARSVGAGFSPGDGSYAEPYLYVSPWPAPAPDELPDLGGLARWHTEDFTSAVLTASELVAAGDARAQAERARRMLHGAVAASLRRLGA